MIGEALGFKIRFLIDERLHINADVALGQYAQAIQTGESDVRHFRGASLTHDGLDAFFVSRGRTDEVDFDVRIFFHELLGDVRHDILEEAGHRVMHIQCGVCESRRGEACRNNQSGESAGKAFHG